ncbi:MAG: DHH family phosphoesterase [Candidatus Micrarchaeota archaeon]|nr:DHH family phosphoesterase [Candidatus Micrarchaeota archaeon]
MGSFLARCKEAREEISRMDDVLIVHHYDADGISSGALVAAALEKMGKGYSRLCFRKLAQKELEEIAKRKERDVILADFGGSVQEELSKMGKRRIVIIDHHLCEEGPILQVNPRLFGIDGSRELSGASTAYFTFGLPELAPIGIVGAVGDVQAPLYGWNKKMLEEGIAGGYVNAYKDICMFGRVSRPLVPFLLYSTEPFLPGLTGNESNVLDFYEKIGIAVKDAEGKWRSYMGLSEDEKMRLRSALVSYLYEKGHKRDAGSIIGEVYELLTYPPRTEMRDASEFSTLLNACGRHNEPDIGVAVMLKMEGAYQRAQALLELHRKQLRDGIEYAQKSVVDMGPFYFVDGRGMIDDGIIGIVAGMLYSIIPPEKPVLAIALDAEGKIKLSSRGTRALIAKGLNLGKSLEKSCNGIGVGGGHDIAAGATIEADKLNVFLERFGKEIGEQIS